MKKLMIAACLMIATSGVLYAQNTKPGNGTPGTNKDNPGYVDANKNAVCDNYENNTRPYARKGQGQGPNRVKGAGYGKGNRQCGAGRGNCNGKRGA
ncbi:MAG: hypothetical protein WAR78_03705 [Ferruginibacter sp.]|nr:hypothetical protein [Chitinophagaceae bacterium]